MPLAPTVPAIRVAVASTGNPGASGSLVSSVTVWDKQALRKVKKKLKPGIFPSIVEQLNYRSVPSKRRLTVLGLPFLPSRFLQSSPARPDSRGAAESQPRPSLGRTPGALRVLPEPSPAQQHPRDTALAPWQLGCTGSAPAGSCQGNAVPGQSSRGAAPSLPAQHGTACPAREKDTAGPGPSATGPLLSMGEWLYLHRISR